MLLVCVLVVLLLNKGSCTSDTSSNSAGLTNSGNTAINSNLSLIQNKINHIMEWCATKNSSLLLQSNMEHIMEQINDNNVNSNLSLIQDTMNSIIQQIMVHANNTNRSTDELLQLLNTSLIKDISIPTAAAVNDVLLIVNELLVIQNRSSLFNSAIQLVSCKDIKATHPNSPSGYYYINSRNTYCNMEELCGQEGGWTRIAYLDMTDSSQNCSSGLEELMIGGIRLCRREGDSAGCRSNAFQTNGISYSQICGKVVGYQKGTTDGVNTNNNDINGVYIDGVSITRGSPRQHVWSYIAGHQSNINGGSTCPCNTGATNTNTVPSFVGEHYYCESGTNSNPSLTEVYTGDPLWDGNNCLSVEAPCCTGTEYIMEQINEHNVNSNLSLTQSTMNQNSLFLNAMDNISLVLQNKIDYLIEQINEHNVNSNFSLIQDTMNSIIQQIMVHANNTNRSTDELLQLLNTSLIKDISIPTAAAVNDVLLIVKELLVIQNGSSTQTVSCKDIRAAHPNSPSGYYHVNSRNTYCNMGELCGQDGGWTRIAYLDMTMNCPSGLQELMAGGIRLCRRGGNSAGCRSNVFQTNGISYSQICGKVVGYQKGTTNAVHANINDINDAYIDGVSITRGSPRQHVWSYIAGYRSNTNEYSCPCNTGATSTVPSFVREHYYCESGTNSGPSKSQVYTGDSLWDGNNCLSKEVSCCNGTGLPWMIIIRKLHRRRAVELRDRKQDNVNK
ncbi:PREDICTED: uncharacterized protein LOC109582444 [Amphimedon queenslandica]|uniref:Fibrinogen C-terminal domain-containing protein n=1 Tax=Amphimedon queenslandica TaxID=400682 RepID=A0AAN0J7P2_AMPQE|nr:PREDICTED: uncharacterized protein LOC109582444 [Amphimedon queenslandica]|eukprot:XP_019852718.1 PREDICTED: uncharacterized protein LOC109582444 [Amphimedon queenslandica]